jgi:hypothetical protein
VFASPTGSLESVNVGGTEQEATADHARPQATFSCPSAHCRYVAFKATCDLARRHAVIVFLRCFWPWHVVAQRLCDGARNRLFNGAADFLADALFYTHVGTSPLSNGKSLQSLV